MCERFGWTLDYADGLDAGEAYRIVDVVQSADKARHDEQRKHRGHRG